MNDDFLNKYRRTCHIAMAKQTWSIMAASQDDKMQENKRSHETDQNKLPSDTLRCLVTR